MGRPVYITNAMPSTGKAIAFGDFSYYWINIRMPISARSINELFCGNQQVGYLAKEYLDGRLIRTDAIKVLQLNQEELLMDTLAKETVLQIDDTVFIIECETSKSSTETAYDKVKKLILNHVKDKENINQLSA